MSLLIIGAGGLIGSALATSLADRDPVACVRPGSPHPERVTTIEIDLAQPIDAAMIPESITAAVFAAQSRAHREFPGGARDMFAVNVRAVHDLLAIGAERGWSQFVMCSTGGVYAPSSAPLTEDSPVEPPNFYARTRLAAETIALGYRETMAITVLRPFFVYGPAQSADMLVPRILGRVRDSLPIDVIGDEGVRLTPTHVSDAIAAIRAVVDEAITGVFNLAGPDSVTIAEMAGIFGSVLGIDPVINHIGGSPTSVVALNDELSARIGFSPEITADEGLRQLAQQTLDPDGGSHP